MLRTAQSRLGIVPHSCVTLCMRSLFCNFGSTKHTHGQCLWKPLAIFLHVSLLYHLPVKPCIFSLIFNTLNVAGNFLPKGCKPHHCFHYSSSRFSLHCQDRFVLVGKYAAANQVQLQTVVVAKAYHCNIGLHGICVVRRNRSNV